MPDTLTLPEAALREAVEQAGGRYVGLQGRRGRVPLVLFDDAAGSTKSLNLERLVAGAVRAVLAEPQDGAALVVELRRLRAAVELLAEVAALDERKPGAWSLVLHRLGRR